MLWCFRQDSAKLLDGQARVINLGDKHGLGTHWVAARVTDEALYYADPFGLVMKGYPPHELRDISEALGIPCIINRVCFQRPSTALCGYYSLCFAEAMREIDRKLDQPSFELLLWSSIA
jgi:hypothetical protein